ncbi:CU044_2847 family protein [Nonomuraea sp. NPDC048826]|uniref:CU044_2847 family protein n=1 Tax=Nonomuraea sp. NPDC048826 TaxID=3364347 RepID=UPI00371BFE76
MDELTLVLIEVDPTSDFRPAGPNQVAGDIREALAPVIRAAEVILEKIKTVAPNEVEVKFGIKVSGTTNWFIAKGATEGNFEVTLKWEAVR